MKKNGALDIIFKIFSILLCIILVPTLIITVIVGTVSDMIKPETLVKVVKTVDVQQIVEAQPEVKESLEKTGVAPEVIDNVLQSNVVEEIFTAYAEDVSQYLITGETNFNVEQLKSILNNNKAEVKEILTSIAPEDVPQEEIEAELDKFIDEEIAPMFDQNLPKPQEITQDIPAELIEIIKVFNSGLVTKICLGACLVLLVLILLLRLRECSFLIWYSIVSTITAFFVVGIYSGISIVPAMLSSDLPVPEKTIQDIISVLTQNMLISFIVLFVLAAVCMTGFFLIRMFRNKTKQVKEEIQTV